MLEVTRIDENKIKVTQKSFGFGRTKESPHYYDFKEKLVSEKPDFPDSMLTKKMTKEDIEWAKKYYIPKAK